MREARDTGAERFLMGQTALVTGAASGIGLAIARHLHQHGAQVVLCDLPGSKLEEVASQLDGARWIAADLGRRDDVERATVEAGAIDILVNNAGLQHVSPVEEFAQEEWDRILAVMLTAPFLLTRGLIGGMYARRWGRIINIASVHGLVASPYKSAYVSAKHGLIGLTKTVALEAAARAPDVTVHAICPSYVRTPLVERQIADQARVHGLSAEDVVGGVMLERNAIKRLIEPEEVAEAAGFLCRDAAWAMTGGVLALDAGRLAY